MVWPASFQPMQSSSECSLSGFVIAFSCLSDDAAEDWGVPFLGDDGDFKYSLRMQVCS